MGVNQPTKVSRLQISDTLLEKQYANESLKRDLLVVPLGGGLTLVDGTTYKLAIPVGRASTVKRISVAATTVMVGGTNTLAVTKNDSTTLLSTANVDPTAVPAAADASEDLTLTSTAADLAVDSNDAIVITLVCGTMTTDGQGYTVVIELEHDDAS